MNTGGERLSKDDNILDYMGSIELSANLYRVTRAQELLRKQDNKPAASAGKAHFEAGEQVREAITRLNEALPEDLPVAGKMHPLANNKTTKGKSRK